MNESQANQPYNGKASIYLAALAGDPGRCEVPSRFLERPAVRMALSKDGTMPDHLGARSPGCVEAVEYIV